MQPRPDATELIFAVRNFLETEIIPTLSDARLPFAIAVTESFVDGGSL